MRIRVKDFMSSPVSTAIGTTPVSEVRAMMEKAGVHAVPIIQISKELPENKVTIRGIVTATDLGVGVADNALVEDVMTSGVHVLHTDLSAGGAARMMLKKNVRHLVVMEDGEIVGIVSSLDFVKLVAEHN